MFPLFILATISCLVDPAASFIIKLIASWCCKETDEDHEMRKELIKLKKEMSSISMVDEFSRYAKLQRKYNKLQDEVKNKLSSRSASRLKVRMSLTYGIRMLNGIFTTLFVFMYRNQPIIVFPNDFLWPIESILSWPTGVDNCISLPSWIILMKLSISSFFKTSTV